MPFERIHMGGPESTEWLQPRIYLVQRLRTKPVQPALRIDGAIDEACVPKYAKVLRHRRLRHSQTALDIPHGLL